MQAHYKSLWVRFGAGVERWWRGVQNPRRSPRAHIEPVAARWRHSVRGQVESLRARGRTARGRAQHGLDAWTDGKFSQVVEALGQRVTRRHAIAAALAVGLLVTAVYWSTRSAPQARHAAVFTVKRGDVTIKISERGELRALDSVTISAQVDLPVIHLVPEGTQAKEGDLLVRFDSSKYEVALDESKSALQVAEAERRRAEQDLEAERERLLAEISRFEAEVRVAELDLEEVKARPRPAELAQAKIELQRSRVAFENAENRRRMLPELVEKGFITKDTLEEAQLEALVAKANLQSAQFNFDRVSAGASPAELEKATLRLEQARFGLEKARQGMESHLQSFAAAVERETANVARAENLMEKAKVKLKRTELYAPQDGLVVYARGDGAHGQGQQVQLGMIPFEGQALIYLPDLSAMVVDTEINEIDVGKVTLGGPADVRLEAYPGVVFPGKILKIGSLAKLRPGSAGSASGIKAFDVTVKVEEQDARLKPGLSAVVDIIVDHQQDAISVPLSAVVTRDGEQVVFVSRSGTLQARPVVLGMSNEHRVIVKEGLRAGEQVVLGPPSSGHP